MRVRLPRIPFAVAAAVLLSVGPTHANAPAGRYTIPVAGAVYDTKTKLTWQQLGGENYTWGSASTLGTAQSYCATVTNPIGTGWRVPTVGELGTLVDYSQAAGAGTTIDSTFFPGTAGDPFWSSTPNVSAPTFAWAVNFYDGETLSIDATTPTWVRCVRRG